MHQAVAFAIASEFCRKRPFARNFCSENDISRNFIRRNTCNRQQINSQRVVRSFVCEIWRPKFASEFSGRVRIRIQPVEGATKVKIARLLRQNRGRTTKKTPYTATTESKPFGKLCWPSEELSRPVADNKNLSKLGKPYLPGNSFLCGAYFLGKEKFLTGAGWAHFCSRGSSQAICYAHKTPHLKWSRKSSCQSVLREFKGTAGAI